MSVSTEPSLHLSLEMSVLRSIRYVALRDQNLSPKAIEN